MDELRIGLGVLRSILSHYFLVMVGTVVCHAYYERVYFSLFNDIFVIQIENR